MKKIMCILLAIIIVMSCFTVTAFAENINDKIRDGAVFKVTHYNPKYPTDGVAEDEKNQNNIMATGELCKAIENITYAEILMFDINTLYVGLPYDAVSKVKALDTVVSVEPYLQSISTSKSPEEKISPELLDVMAEASPDDVLKGVVITFSYNHMVYYGFNEQDFSDPQEYIEAKRAVDKEYHTKINTQLFEEIKKEVDMKLLSTSKFGCFVIVEIKASEIEKLSKMLQVFSIDAPASEEPYDTPTEIPTQNSTEAPEPEFKYEEKFQEYIRIPKYDLDIHEDTFGTYSEYDELYEHHKEATDEVDWALVTAKCDLIDPWEVLKTKRIGNRVLSWWTYGAAMLPYKLAVYDAKEDKFLSLEIVNAEDYDGLVEAIDELKLGYQIGDFDLDKEVTILDATRIQKYVAQITKYNSAEFQLIRGVSDMDDDGEVSILDATAIQLKLAQLDTPKEHDTTLVYADLGAKVDMPSNAKDIPFEVMKSHNSYGLDTGYHDYGAVIKTKEQLDELLPIYKDTIDESIFKDKFIVATNLTASCDEEVVEITQLGVVGDTLYIAYKKYTTSVMVSPTTPPFINILVVDKDNVANVKNIEWVDGFK